MKFKGLPDDGFLWRLDGYGGVFLHPTMTSQLSFYAAISPIQNSLNKSVFDRFGSHEFGIQHQQPFKAQIAEFGIGELVTLPIGVISKGGQLQHLPKTLYAHETFTLDFDNQQLCQLKNGILGERWLIPRSAYQFGKAWNDVKASTYICLPISEHHSTNPKLIKHEYAVMFPVMEMARACYGRSSKLLQAVFSYELSDLIEWIRERGSLDRDQLYTMELPAPFAQNDAWVLAWLALDEHAECCAKQLMGSVARAVTDSQFGHPVFPEALFPFTGTAKITVLGKWVGLDNSPNQRFMVYRIQEIEYPMPYTNVAIQIDRSGEVVDEAEGGMQMYHKRRIRNVGPESEIRNDVEPNISAAEILLSTNQRQPFVDLRDKTPQKVPRDCGYDPTTVSKINFSGTPNLTADLSTGEGEFSSEARKTNLSESDQPQEGSNWPDKIPPDLQTVLEAVNILKMQGVSANFLQVGPHYPSSNDLGVAVSWFPNKNNWSWIDLRARMVLVIHLQLNGRNYYLLEKEHDDDLSVCHNRSVFGYIPLICKPDYAPVDHVLLAQLLQIWAQNLGKWPRKGLPGGLNIDRLRHDYNSPEELALRISRTVDPDDLAPSLS